MRTLSKIALGTAAAVGLGFAAMAFSQGPGLGGGYGPGMGMHGYGAGMQGPRGFGGYGAASMESQLTSLKSELKLAENQAKAWEAFETAVRSQAASMAGMYATMRAGQPNPDAHIAIMEQRLAGMKAVQKARTDLYDALTPEQRTVFDNAGPCRYRG
jgi:hypothetical protein